VSCENKYSLLDCIFFSLILNVNSKAKVFLLDDFNFKDSTNEDNLNDMGNFLSSDNEHNLDQNDVDKNNNLVEKLKSDNDEKNNDAKDVNIIES